MTVQAMSGEFDRIARFFRPLTQGALAARELRDDAAVLTPPPGQELVVTTDAMIAGVHFLPTDPPDSIGAKLLAVNLSDLAAMGASPWAYTLTIALPSSVNEGFLARFAQGLAQMQAVSGLVLVGGDSVSISGPTALSVTAMGLVPPGAAIARSGAHAGDDVYVSGTIGDAAFGLDVVMGRLEAVPNAGALVARLRSPSPRSKLGVNLRGIATACVDVSDGLVADLGHIAFASQVVIEIEASRVPMSDAARAVVAAGPPERLTRALTGGDDYELVFTAAPARRAEVQAVAGDTPVRVIGRVLADSCTTHTEHTGCTGVRRGGSSPSGAVRVVGPGGRALKINHAGWRHS